jgi:metal-responsive CopG/Arc/MetJ family transcriptional regulator
MGRKPLGERAAPQIFVRLPDEIGVRVDAYAKALGVKTRSEAVRQLLLLGLSTHHENEHKRIVKAKQEMTSDPSKNGPAP